MKHLIFIMACLVSFSATAEEIGKVKTKGLVFKDTITIHAFDDPTIEGVTCYATETDRSLSFDESSDSSLACRQTGPIKGKLGPKKNVFKMHKSLFFKSTVVDRFYDKKRNVLVYLTYTKDTDGDNASHSISVVVINGR